MTEQTSQNPLVSCIIIFLNAGEQFFIEAIASIFAQTYDHWELLLVDDGSTDESTAIALRYAQQYPEKVRYIEHEGHRNRGMSATRNLGVRHAQGDFIAFLDADDVWLPTKLEQQLDMISPYPEAALVWGVTQLWYSWTGKPEDRSKDFMRAIGNGVCPNKLYFPPTLLSLYLQQKADTPATCSALIRRNVFEEIGLFEESFQGMCEDAVFFSKVYAKLPVFVSDQCLDRYRQHSNSHHHLAQNKSDVFFDDYSSFRPYYLKYLNWLATFLAEQKIYHFGLWHSLQKNLLLYRHPLLFRLSKKFGHLSYKLNKLFV